MILLFGVKVGCRHKAQSEFGFQKDVWAQKERIINTLFSGDQRFVAQLIADFQGHKSKPKFDYQDSPTLSRSF